MLATLGKFWQNGMKYNHLVIKNLPYKPLYISPGSKCLEIDSRCSDLIGAMSAFNCLFLGHYFSDQAEFSLVAISKCFSECKAKIKIF